MEYLIFYYGTCLMGLVSIVSMLAIYTSNKRVLKESKNPAQAKEKWTANFIAEHQKLLKDNIQIHNPAVYVMKRMRGRKIGPWSMHQIKGISWITLCLSFLFAGAQFFFIGRGQRQSCKTFPIKGRASCHEPYSIYYHWTWNCTFGGKNINRNRISRGRNRNKSIGLCGKSQNIKCLCAENEEELWST